MRLTVDGCETYVHSAQRTLDPGDPTILMIHGAGQDHTLWRIQTRTLAAGGSNALAVDLPGHGMSRGRPLQTISAMARWSAELLEQLDVQRVVVVGHSMGALISIQLASDRPNLVGGMVLSGASVVMRVHEQLLAKAADGDDEAIELIVGWAHTGSGRMGTAVQPGMWEPGVARRIMGSDVSVLSSDLIACDRHRFERLDLVRCRVVVVAGTADRMTPLRGAEKLASLLPDAQLVLVPGAGHDLVSRAHRTVTDAIRQASKHAFGGSAR